MKPSRGGEPIVRSLIWKFVPDELIRWNDAAGLSSEQLIMVDQVEAPGGSTVRAITRKRDSHPLARVQDRYIHVESSRFRRGNRHGAHRIGRQIDRRAKSLANNWSHRGH